MSGFGKTKITIFDNADIFEGKLNELVEQDIGYDIEIATEKLNIDEIKEQINQGNIEEALYIEEIENNVNMQYIVASESLMTEPPQNLLNILQSTYRDLQLSKLGIDIVFVDVPFNFEMSQADNNKVGNNILPMMILSMVLFYAVYFFAYQVSSSITTEKTSKIIETLVTSTSPRIIVLGKTIGIGFAGICQTAVTVLVTIISANKFLEEGIINEILDSINLSSDVAIITAIYYVLGYTLFALLYSLTGSTVAKSEDIQAANRPVALLAMIGFYLSYFTMMNPASELNQFAAILPISSPFCMPFRVMMDLNTKNELLISIGVLFVTILAVAKVSIKIYSSAILNYGSRLSLKELFRIYKNRG